MILGERKFRKQIYRKGMDLDKLNSIVTSKKKNLMETKVGVEGAVY